MASGGEVPGQNPGRAWSEDLDQLKCQPCLEDGHLHEAVGMCVNCDDYLCQTCYQGHTLPKPMRKHKLLDLEEMDQGQIRPSIRDMCTEKCQVHEDEITKYYCTKHHRLGCTVCITLDHKACEGTRYIPHVAKELANNVEYIQAEKRLKSALDTFKKVSYNANQNSEDLEISCAKAVKSIKEFRRSVDEVLGKIEAELIEKVEAIKAWEMKELAAIRDKYKAAKEELETVWTKIETLLDSQQNCSAYISMMKMQEMLTNLEPLIDQATRDASYDKRQILFLPNRATLESLRLPDALGTVSGSVRTARTSKRIERLKHDRDLNVKTGTDTATCGITGLVILPGGRLLLTDDNNTNIKAIDVQSGKMLSQLKLSSKPWDVTAINSSKVAVTLPVDKKVVFITVGDSTMSMNNTLDVDGKCYGVDHRKDKLAVSYGNPNKVQVLSLQGSVLHTLTADKLGNAFFNWPLYLTYGQDDTTLYVSNYRGDNVVCVKLDGTVVGEYTDNKLKNGPLQPVVDNNGDVLVCAGGNCRDVHQMTGDCEKLRVLLTKAGGLGNAHSICFNEKKDRVYIGMGSSNIVKVYRVERVSR